MNDLTMMTVSQVSSLIRQRKVSPLEVVEEAIAVTNRLQGSLNPYITFLEEDARTQATKLTRDMPRDLEDRPLYGLPVGLKDLFCTKGILTSGASELYADFIPTYDATVTARLRQAGAVIMGKLNMQELACGAAGDLSYYGPMRNPYDPSMISGGSSGGSAIAVATGMNYIAMGSDTGGSIRIPASMCGVVGFKPSHGLLSLYGVMPMSGTMDHAGPLTRSVMDAAITMDALTGFDPLDTSPNSYKGQPTHFAQQLQGVDRLDGFRIGVPENYFFEKTDISVETLVREAIRALEDLGAEVIPVAFDFIDDLPQVSFDLMIAEAAWNYRDAITQTPCKITPSIRDRLALGLDVSAVTYLDALERRRQMLLQWERILKQVDMVVCPTLPLTAFPIEGDHQICLRGQQEKAVKMCTHHTRFANVTGIPALTIPVGLAENGLPVGMMLMGTPRDDLGVLKVGYAYERHFPFRYPRF